MTALPRQIEQPLRSLRRKLVRLLANEPQFIAAPVDVPCLDIAREVAPWSMVHETGVAFSAESAVRTIQEDVPGVLVECGVWRGGCSMAMLIAQKRAFGKVVRPVYMLDSFEGLPPVDDRDGPLAAAWQNQAQPDKFLDNCAASDDQLRKDMAGHGFEENRDYFVVKGWFNQTVGPLAERIKDQGIAVLRLDGDWYESTMVCLEALEPLLSKDGAAIIDDYYAWDGCARAVHDYLSRNDLPYRIKSLPYNFGAYFIKKPARESFNEF